MIPSLEGSTHINLRLTCQFMKAYFAAPDPDSDVPLSLLLGEIEPVENPYWFAATERNPKSVVFSNYRRAFKPLRGVANVRALVKQIAAFRRFVDIAMQQEDDSIDIAITIAIGRCFSTIVYAQLIAEMSHKAGVPIPVVSVVFAGLIEDFSAEALKLAALFGRTSIPRSLLKKIVRIPQSSVDEFDFVSQTIASRYGR